MKKSWISLILLLFIINVYAVAPWQKGKEAYDKGNYSEAIFYFKKATEADPQAGDYFRWLAHAYYENGQYPEAAGAYEQALSLPHSKDRENESWEFLAKAYEKSGQTDSLISFREKYIGLEPNDFFNFSELAKLYIKNIQYDKAITTAKRAIELKSDYADAFKTLGVAYGKNMQYDDAIRAYKRAIEIEMKLTADYVPIGFFLMEKKAYEEAAGAYKRLIDADSSNPDLHSFLAEAYYCMGRYDDALAAVNRAIEIETYAGDFSKSRFGKSMAFSYGLRSLIYRFKGNREESSRDAAEAFSHDSPSYTYLTFGKNKEDEKEYSLDPFWDRLPYGAAFLDRGQYDEAIQQLSQLEGPMARLFEATAYVKQGKVKEAANALSSISEEDLSPKNIPLMTERMALLQLFKPYVEKFRVKARSLEAKGLLKEALSELSEALKIADDSQAPAIQEAIFAMARRTRALELPEEARECALRAEMLVKDGEFERAAGEYIKAIRIAPYFARLYFNAALVNAELKKYADAIRLMKIYLQAAPDAPDARAAKDQIIKWKFMLEKEEGN